MENVVLYVALGAGFIVLVAILMILKWVFGLRRVVPTDEVHIVRSSKASTVYGTPQDSLSDEEKALFKGNSYYEWPEWMPGIGVMVKKLNLSIFEIEIENYSAYDQDKVPFSLDMKAFFRIDNFIKAASRVANLDELKNQLRSIVEGAARTVLAQDKLPDIMVKRGKYGDEFTNEIREQLAEWGVEPVKNIELMDIRDTKDGNVVKDIMEKTKAVINKESRVAIAVNEKIAQDAEIESKREIALKEQDKLEAVGKREAEVEQVTGIAKERSKQAVQEEAKITAEKEMAVEKVKTVEQAKIDKEQTIIAAEAEASKANTEADATLYTEKKAAEGIAAKGTAEADAAEKMEMAKITPQMELAKEIGSNAAYQAYLIEVRKVEATERVGMEQAKNISGSSIKIVAGGEGISGGVSNAMELFSGKGGFAIGQALEAFAGTDAGKALLAKMGIEQTKAEDASDAGEGSSTSQDVDFEEVK